jgi:hypothetical protein
MKQFRSIALLLTILIGVGLMASCSPKSATNNENVQTETTPSADVQTYGAKSALVDDSLTVDKMLQYAIQDEYLIRSHYESYILAFGDIPPFSNLKDTEDYHIEELKKLFKAYTLDVSEDFSKDYIVKAPDANSAIQNAIDRDLQNVDMYQKFLEMDLPIDIFNTFSMLRADSMMHTEELEKNKKQE